MGKFDLTSVEQLDSVQLTILHPSTKEPTDIKITLAGPNHPRTKEARRMMLDAMTKDVKDQATKGQITVGARVDITPEATEEALLRAIVHRTLGWEGMAEHDQDVEFSPENARRIYSTQTYSWLRDQVDKALAIDANFFV